VRAIERAAATPFAVWQAIGRRPSEMPARGLPGVLSKGIILVERFGGDAEEFSKLHQLASVLLRAFNTFRGRAWTYALLALVNAAICGASYAILFRTAAFLASTLPASAVAPVAGPAAVRGLEEALGAAMAVNSVALSIVVASVRHGNAAYAALYLPLFALAHYGAWLAGLPLAASLLGA